MENLCHHLDNRTFHSDSLRMCLFNSEGFGNTATFQMDQLVVSNFSLWDMKNLVCEDGCFVYGTTHSCRMAGDPRVKYLADSFVVHGYMLYVQR